MKVSPSPFEAPRESVAVDAADRARSQIHRSEADPAVEAAAISDVNTEIDSATRESLSRLASLIRTQLKASDAATAATLEEARLEQEEAAANERRNKRAREIAENGDDEEMAREAVARSSYPTVVRIEKRFEEERRKRGLDIYTKQKTKESVQAILSALEDVVPPDDPFAGLTDTVFDDDASGEDAA